MLNVAATGDEAAQETELADLSEKLNGDAAVELTDDQTKAHVEINRSESSNESNSPPKRGLRRAIATTKRYAPPVLKLTLFVAFNVYFAFSMKCNFGNKIGTKMLVLTAIIYLYLATKYLPRIKCLAQCTSKLSSGDFYCCKLSDKKKKICKIALAVLLILAIAAVVVVCAVQSPYNLVSFGGIFVLIGVCYLFSNHRKQVSAL